MHWQLSLTVESYSWDDEDLPEWWGSRITAQRRTGIHFFLKDDKPLHKPVHLLLSSKAFACARASDNQMTRGHAIQTDRRMTELTRKRDDLQYSIQATYIQEPNPGLFHTPHSRITGAQFPTSETSNPCSHPRSPRGSTNSQRRESSWRVVILSSTRHPAGPDMMWTSVADCPCWLPDSVMWNNTSVGPCSLLSRQGIDQILKWFSASRCAWFVPMGYRPHFGTCYSCGSTTPVPEFQLRCTPVEV